MALVNPRTRGAIIAALHTAGAWHGSRRGVRMIIWLATQTEIDGDRVHWTAYIRGHYKLRRKGRAGTVAEALAQIEKAVRA